MILLFIFIVSFFSNNFLPHILFSWKCFRFWSYTSFFYKINLAKMWNCPFNFCMSSNSLKGNLPSEVMEDISFLGVDKKERIGWTKDFLTCINKSSHVKIYQVAILSFNHFRSKSLIEALQWSAAPTAA